MRRLTGWRRRSRLPQEEQEFTFEEAKTVVKEIQRRRWRQEHPDYGDGYYHLSREDQVIIVRLRTVHCRLKHHMFTNSTSVTLQHALVAHRG
nr:hypothetical protein BaRGS_026644 [Batillaria attramentaria]